MCGGLAAARLLGTSPCQPLLAQLLARPADSHGHLLTPTHGRWRAVGPSGFPGLPRPSPAACLRAPSLFLRPQAPPALPRPPRPSASNLGRWEGGGGAVQMPPSSPALGWAFCGEEGGEDLEGG